MAFFDKGKKADNPPPEPTPTQSVMRESVSKEQDNKQEEAPKVMSDSSLQAAGNAVVGRSIKMKGEISGDENLLVEGNVEGTVTLENNDLTVGETGSVHADVRAKTVRIEGEVVGDITGLERVVITQKGRVRGNITAPRVLVEDGAKFKGSIDMDVDTGSAKQPVSSAKKIAPETAQTAAS